MPSRLRPPQRRRWGWAAGWACVQGLLFPVVAAGGEVADFDTEATDLVLLAGSTVFPQVAAAIEKMHEASQGTAIGRKIHESGEPSEGRWANTLSA